MRRRHKPISREGETRSDNWRLWDVYYDRVVNTNQLEQFMPAHRDISVALSRSRRWTDEHDLYFIFMLTNLQEHSGES